MSWYKAAQVSVENGSKLVTVVSAEPLTGIRSHDSLEIAQFNGVDIDITYTDPATDDLIIKLVSGWPHATQTLQSAQVVPTAVNFNVGAQILEDTKNKVFTHLASYFAFGTQASGTVTFQGVGVDDSDITLRSIPQYRTDLDALENQVGGSVASVNAIDTQVNGAGGLIDQVDAAASSLLGIDTVISGYMATTEGYRDSALDARDTSEGYRDEALAFKNTTEGYRDTTIGYVTMTEGYRDEAETYKSGAVSAKNLAEQYRDEAEDFKNQAGNIAGGDFVTKSTTVNGKALSGNITIEATDLNLGSVDNTSDADKPISTSAQSALDNKANQSALDALETAIGLPALQARLDEIEILALAGL
jgi:hypothetical protein